MTARVAAACWLVAGIVYLSLEAVAARAFPGYDYAHNFISDLGRADSPLSPLMNAAFAIQGTLLFAGAALVARGRHARLFVACAAANAVGNVVVASVSSDSPGVSWLHVAGAVVAILGGNVVILAGASIVESIGAQRFYRSASYGLAVLGLVSFALLAVASTARIDVFLPSAVWERASVYTIIAWQMASAFQLLFHRRQSTS